MAQLMPPLLCAKFRTALAWNVFSLSTRLLLIMWRLSPRARFAVAVFITFARSKARPPVSSPVRVMEAPRNQLNLSERFNPVSIVAAGLDEVGRGCLAGPVVAAAVILPREINLPYLADSKKLSAKKREYLAPIIKRQSIAWSIGCVWPARIDEINILAASLEAMSRAAASLKSPPQKLLLDGNQKIPSAVLQKSWSRYHTSPCPTQEAIEGGDAIVPAISAASIIAKTYRDCLMTILGRHFPQYGFERHMGYGTKEHMLALAEFGPSRLHRLSFNGVMARKTAQGSLI